MVVAVIAGALLALLAIALLIERGREEPASPAAERPELLLLTSLPIVFPEQLGLEDAGSPALEALQKRYHVVPISLADRQSLAGHRLLLMAQPQAQPAQGLVDLDDWVRGGGRAVLLADPALEWPSDRPLGDALRPPPAFADTGLLIHWGLRLDSPDTFNSRSLDVDGQQIRTAAPGELVATARNCALDPARLVARCRIGKGMATVIADADFLDADRFGRPNLDLLNAELSRLSR